MPITLAENIRAFRKARSLTQEQLAEVLGVTVGAVYKWEAGLSQPELATIVELADFFDASVDVLLGYQMKDNRLQATVERLDQYRRNKDRAGIAAAEKALKKYPNAFSVVYKSALLYRSFAVETPQKPLLLRAMALLENARLLLPQNTDPRVSEGTICAEMADIQLALGHADEAVALLQKHNAAGMYNDIIGMTLAADCKRPDDALPYLSEALLDRIASLLRTVMGFINVYIPRGDFSTAADLLQWTLTSMEGLRCAGSVSCLDKINCFLLTCLSYVRFRLGDSSGAGDHLRHAMALAASFDAAPDYSTAGIRFAAGGRLHSVYDSLGDTSLSCIENTIASLEDPAFSALWKELTAHET